MFRPAAWLVLNRAKAQLTGPDVRGLILGSRLALRLWEGVRDKKWSFLSPPWYLRDKGTVYYAPWYYLRQYVSD